MLVSLDRLWGLGSGRTVRVLAIVSMAGWCGGCRRVRARATTLERTTPLGARHAAALRTCKRAISRCAVGVWGLRAGGPMLSWHMEFAPPILPIRERWAVALREL